MPLKKRYVLRLIWFALGGLLAATGTANACPLVTEYAEMWTQDEGAYEGTVPLYAYGSVETCGTDLPADMLLELKTGGTVLDTEWSYGYGYIEAYASVELTEASPEGSYVANVQAWLGEEHFGCYDAVQFISIVITNYRLDGLVTIDGHELARYVRCVTGPCQTMYLPKVGTMPAFKELYILRNSNGFTAQCYSILSNPIASCGG